MREKVFSGRSLKCLNLHYGARFYDPAVGRWWVTDKYNELHSSYAYGPNDPINGIDPDGNGWGSKVLKVGKALYKGASMAEAFAGNIQDAKTVFNGNASTSDRIIAGLSLASEIAPVSVDDVRDIWKWGKKLFKAKKADKVVTVAAKKIDDALPDLQPGQKVYRVYGGDSKPNGASWSTTNPAEVNNYRDFAGLPSGLNGEANNTGQFVIEAIVNDPSKVVKKRTAIPMHGNTGGAPEYINTGCLKQWRSKRSTSKWCKP